MRMSDWCSDVCSSDLLTPAIYPELARLTARGDIGGRRDMVVRSALLMGGMSAVAFGVLVLVGEPLIELIAGAGFEDAYGTMLLLALAGVVSNCTFSLEPLLISVGREIGRASCRESVCQYV